MYDLHDDGEMVLYLGPLKVPLISRGTIFARKDSREVIGYPSSRNSITIIYRMRGDVSPYLQSLFRNPEILKKWAGLLCIGTGVSSGGKMWKGKLRYDWATNELVSKLEC